MIGKILKPVEWIGSSYKDFTSLPELVQQEMGYALYLAQTGRMHLRAKPLKGFGGAHIVELVEDDRSGTYRAVYTAKFESAVYVLHAFQKKSTKGIRTPRADIETVLRRLKIADADNRARMTEGRM
jgi:phage-related protein